MTIKTNHSHVYTAIEIQKERDSTYLAIGRESRWIMDTNPPNEDPNATSLEEVQGYKHVKRMSLARPLRPDELPETVGYPIVTYNNTNWALIPNEKAYEEQASWVYIEAELFPSDLPLKEYRQVGIHMGLKPKEGITKPNLLPEEVEDTGVLMFYENRPPQSRTPTVYVLEQFIIKV